MSLPETLPVHLWGDPTQPLDLLDVDLHSPDPWPLYTWLREEAPLYRDANGLWHISRYDDIVSASKQPERFTSIHGNRPLLPADSSFIHLDGDAHRKRRALVQAHFAPPAIRLLEQHIRDAVDELIDAVIERGECDFIEDIAAPLPVRLIAEMTGIPAEHHASVQRALEVFVPAGNGPDHLTDEVNEAFFEFGRLHMELVDERRARPRDDLLSLWVHATVDGEPMNEDELLFEHTMLIVGGAETTRNAISGGVEALGRNPDQRAWLAAHPTGMPNAAEEMIRWVTPFVSMSRTVVHDTEWMGERLREGDTLVMLYPPANRDPRHFVAPDRFDVRREFTSRQLAFGYGRHVCLGAHLARLEATVVVEQLMRRMPDWQIAGEVPWARSCFIRGPTRLPLRFTPGRRVRS